MVIETTVDPDDPKLYSSSMKSDWILDFTMSGAKQTFADIIVYLFGLFLIYFLVKMVVSIKTWISFIDDSMDNTFKSFENVLTNLPIIPIAGWIGINALKQADLGQAATRLAWINVADQHARYSSFLGLWDSFSHLNTSMNRAEFITKAVSVGKWRQLTYDKLWSDQEFGLKLNDWNRRNDPQNPITIEEIRLEYVWKKDKVEDAETTTSETTSGTDVPKE